jgi:hypothetical protein
VSASNGSRPKDKPPGTAADWSALQYRPAPSTPLRTCCCGARYLDDGPSRDAHRIVFGHRPAQPREEP